MRAVRVVGPGILELADVPEPETTGGVLVKASRVGICGTDVKIVAGTIPVDYPRIVGHELVGNVETAPSGVSFAVGDRVLVDPGVACGSCAMCLVGRTNICLVGGLLGRDVDGVFAEYSVAPPDRLLAIPESITDRAAGVLQVLGTCVHAVSALETSPGQVAAVIGLGVSGQLISQLLTLRGVQVVGVTRSGWKRELASSLGADATSEPGRAQQVLDEMTSGLGPQIVVEAVGQEATFAEAISLAATGGEVIVFGTLTSGGKGLPYYELYHKELTVRNPRAAVMGDYAEGIALAAAGQLQLEPLVSHVLDLDRAAEAFDLVHDPTAMKVLMEV
jgi:2-desacetyl-2-hydroxyethyl bacteriochlorophyllide A dehydrogenase